MKQLHGPANQVEPDQVVVDQVYHSRMPLQLVEVKGHDEEESQERSQEEHADLELVERDHSPQGVKLDEEVAQFDQEQDDCLEQQVVDQERVNGPEQQGVGRPFEGLEDHCLFAVVPAVLQEVLDEFLVVKVEPEQSADAEDDQEEKEEDHGHVEQLVGEVEAEEVPALEEEVEGELLDVPLVDQHQEQPEEGVLSEVLGDPVVEESPEDQRQKDVGDDHPGQFVVEEVEIVAEEREAVGVFLQEKGVSVVLFVVKLGLEFLVNVVDRVTDGKITILNQCLRERAFFECKIVNVRKKSVRR